MNLAISQSSDPAFGSLLINSGIDVYPYTGKFADLLHLNKGLGTLAGLLTNFRENAAQINLNGTFLHAPGIALNAINQYFLKLVVFIF